MPGIVKVSTDVISFNTTSNSRRWITIFIHKLQMGELRLRESLVQNS